MAGRIPVTGVRTSAGLKPALLNRVHTWIIVALDLSVNPTPIAEELWRTHWRLRRKATIAARPADVQLVEHIRHWTDDVRERILKLNAQEWTQLERELVVRWTWRTYLGRHRGVA